MAEAKWVLVIPRKLLKVVNLWPDAFDNSRKVTYFIMLMMMIFVEGGQVYFLIKNIRDITAMAATMSTISTTFQAISAFIFGIGIIGRPVIQGAKELPLISLFPFDCTESPVYEIIYCVQAVVDLYFAIISICGHDDLFLAICFNCLVQFRILKEVLVNVTRGNLKSLTDYEKENVENQQDEKKNYIECVEHHVLLLRVYNIIEKIFSLSNFVQLLCSVTAICVSSFLIVMTDNTQMVHLTSYCVGHILQLFLCCSAANELSYESQNLSNFAFNSDWYSKKDVIMTLMLAQKPKTLSALGIVEINYATFISVMRLSFSFYTLLSKIVEK
ncbi:hypothetical protein FQR65_LT01887 [Abscondita terminalis]|nr:hypothetical protein FQR65_LT01887 [Abscondita terminalis]